MRSSVDKERSSAHTELSTACLAAQILDTTGFSMPTIPDQDLDAFVYDTEINAIQVWAGISFNLA